MRRELSTVERFKTTRTGRRLAAAALAGGLLVLVGCASSGDTNDGGAALKACKAGWEVAPARTTNPSGAHSSMQHAIAELIDKVSKATPQGAGSAYEMSKIPADLRGAAGAVLTHNEYNSAIVYPESALQDYSVEACVGDQQKDALYLTPAYWMAVGALASADIAVDTYSVPNPSATASAVN